MNDEEPALVHVLISVFEDRASVMELLRRIDNVAADGMRFRVLLVDNGSTLSPIEAADIPPLGFEVEIITLGLNLGQQRALAIGLSHLTTRNDTETVVVMDGDGEDRPSDIPRLAADVVSGQADIVVAGRGRRRDRLLLKAMRGAYRLVFSLMTGERLPYGNFSAISGRTLRRLVSMEELWAHYPATLRRTGFKIEQIDLDRGDRYEGESKYNLVSLTVHALRSFVPFSETVLARVLWACGIVTGLGLIALIAAALIKAFGFASPGWLTLVAGSVLTVILQIGAIALITMLIATTNRPGGDRIPVTMAANFVTRQVIVPKGPKAAAPTSAKP